MFLKRVQVPDFRVLQDVDISFEPDFFPKIFPLGSLNGGGKSTLLQLIFVLLHCSFDSKKLEFVKNLLYDFNTHNDSKKRTLAKFEIWDGKENKNFEFLIYNNSYFKEKFSDLFQQYKSIQQYKSDINFNLLYFIPLELQELSAEIFVLKEDLISLKKSLINIEKYKKFHNEAEKAVSIGLELNKLFELNITQKDARLSSIYHEIEATGNISPSSAEKVIQIVQEKIEFYQLNFDGFCKKQANLKVISDKLQEYLQSENFLFISTYTIQKNEDIEVLFCRHNDQNIEQAKSFLNQLSERIFLAAPSTQIFLFLSQQSRKFLFQEKNKENLDSQENYNLQLELAQLKLSGFFTYDFFAVDLLVKAFKEARDKDFKTAIKTGKYGENYQNLLNDLNSLLQNKKININQDLSGVNFKLIKDNEEIDLYPEDLSHGELKRLSIYMWLKYRNIEDAIVLMDEIEIALHPDWQYQIVRDLEEWENSNQYILATHSYELCTALTPDHVKELEPKLLKPKPIQ